MASPEFFPALRMGAYQPLFVSNLRILHFRRSFTKFFTALFPYQTGLTWLAAVIPIIHHP